MCEDNYLLISGIQHFDFCRRQWALIHIEQQWKDNVLTAEGENVHLRCHNDLIYEKRGSSLTVRGMRVVSHNLKMTGVCDVVEFTADEQGIELQNHEGRWQPAPVEYKHGASKTIDADRLQLCAQAIALEEMFVCDIRYGYIYYAKTRKRECVELTDALREMTTNMAKEMSELFGRGHTPNVRKSIKCRSCSLYDICIPQIVSEPSVSKYIDSMLKETDEEIS